MDSPGSPLSDLSSDDFHEEEHAHASVHALSDAEHDADSSRPSKRQRVNGPGDPAAWENLPTAPPEEDISSDSESSVPGSPHMGAAGGNDDEDFGGYGHREQISTCKWEGCEAGDLGNMDLLVQHLHDEHIHARQKKYSCEWGDCNRKGIPHASGYALRAHMRSHTREKPFYCSLPECDRSFTRSDALAKHMRTVHETEALRPSDPVPKHHSSNPQNKSQRVRLTFKGLGGGPASNGHNEPNVKAPEAPKSAKSNISAPASPSTGPTIPPADLDYEHSNVVFHPTTLSRSGDDRQFPPDIHFSDWELALSPPDLLKALKVHLSEATAESASLRHSLDLLEERRKNEWTAKELIIENVLESEHKILQARGGGDLDSASLQAMLKDVEPARLLDVHGDSVPWWRKGDDWDGEANGKEKESRGMDELGLAEQEAIGAMVKMEGGA